MNFYKLTSNLKDGISVLNHSSNKINLKVPLSSYHDEAQKFLEHLKSSENSDANEPSGLVPSQDQEIDSEEVREKIIEQENLFVQSVHEMIMKAFYQATQYDIDGLIDDVFGTGVNPDPDEPTYSPDDIATEKELNDAITDVFG